VEYLFYDPTLHIDSKETVLPEQEARHCTKVLRKAEGDSLQLTDGRGGRYTGKLLSITKKQVTVRLLEVEKVEKRPFSIHLAIAPTKNSDRIEFFTEKAVEIGVERISFIHSQYSERKNLRLDRIERVAASAMKQSQNLFLPEIENSQPFETWLQQLQTSNRLLAWEGEPLENLIGKGMVERESGNDWCLLVGPEGGFSPEELSLAEAHKFKKVSLGPSRLRTETAGIVGCALLNHLLLSSDL